MKFDCKETPMSENTLAFRTVYARIWSYVLYWDRNMPQYENET